MTDFATTHYDIDHETRGKQMLILDAFKGMAEVIDNDVIPSTKDKPLVSGIENPASTLRSSGNVWTTVPLKPLTQYVNFLFENYINVSFNFSVKATASIDIHTLPYLLAVYFPCTACIPSRLQLMCGNAIVWQNQFQRYEALVSMASIKASYLDKDEQYVSIEKLLRKDEIPGVYLTPDVFTDNTEKELKFTINCNIDLNQLSPIFSNIPFVTQDMGDMRLRLFFDDLEKGLCITPIPLDYVQENENAHSRFEFRSGIVGRYPCIKGVQIALPTTNTIIDNTTNDASIQDVSASITIGDISWDTFGNFGVQISQCTFNVVDESKVAIAKYIGEDNKLSIPTQTWSTVQSTTTPAGNGETIFQISALNIALIAFIFPFIEGTDVILPNPFIADVDIKLNSKSLTYIPYKQIGYRALKDTAQAFLNNDKYAFNDVLKNSLIAGPLSSVNYTNVATNTHLQQTLQNRTATLGGYNAYWKDDNNFVLALGLEPPNSFEKGYCIASSNPQSTQVRVAYSVPGVRSLIQTYPVTKPNTPNPNIFQYDLGSANAPKMNPYCLALQDCLVVLDYNPVIGSCLSGTVKYEDTITV